MGISNSMGWTAICSAILLTTPALGESLELTTVSGCDTSELIGQTLFVKYGEKPLALGEGLVYIQYRDGSVVPTAGLWTLWTNQTSGSFTNTVSFNDGITCIVTSGSKFEPFVE